MKEGWTYKKLGEVCKIATGKRDANHAQENGQYRFYTCAAKYLMCDTYTFEGDCLILPGNGANVGEVYIYSGKFDAYQRTYVLNQIKEEILHKYLFYYFLCKWKKQGTAKQYGAATNYIIMSNFTDFIVGYPTLPVQQQIVSRLDAAFAEIDALKANAEKQLNEARALFQKALEEEMTPKEGWEEKTIIDVAKYRSGIAHEKVICDDGCFVVINSKFVSSDGKIKKYSNKQLAPLYKDDIVMVLSDVPKGKTLAKCYIIEQDNLYTLNQRICAFESKGIITRFLYYMLNRNPHLLGYDNGENQTNLRVKNVTECPVYYPNDKDTQQQIVARLDALSVNIKQLEELQRKTLAECDALKQAMLREIFE